MMDQREASQPPVDAFLVEVDEDGIDEDEDDDYFLSQELEAKLEASRLREEQLIAEVEAVRVVSTVSSKRGSKVPPHDNSDQARRASSESLPVARYPSYGGSIKNIPQVQFDTE